MVSHKSEAIQDFAPDRTAQALLNLRCAVDHCHDAVFITNASGALEFVNPAFEALTGYAAPEAIQGGLELIFETTDGSARGGRTTGQCKELLREVLKNGLDRRPVRVVRKDGRRIEFDLTMAVVRDYRTRTASIVCTGRDITNENELHAELRNARRLDIIGTVASGVAHDLNNLLMVINAYAELGLQTLYHEHPLRRNLKEILSAARRAADLSRQLLASGCGLVPGLHAMKLNSVIEDAARLLPYVLGEDVELRVFLSEDVGSITADAGQIERALLNLAVNARDAMPAGGVFSIKTELVSSDEGGEDACTRTQHVLLEVSDTGNGISREEISKIFLPFYSTKEEQKGNGLGLAIVERTVKQSGGFIRVESEPGKGTSFRLYFPLAGREGQSKRIAEPTSEAVPHGSGTVLVVEDNDAVRESSVEFLSSVGYNVLSASNGEEALRIASSRRGGIDLMVADVVMPHVSGAMLAARLAESQPHMQVLFVSGHAESAVRRKGIAPDAEVLQKPYPLGVLATKLRDKLQPAARSRAAIAGNQ